MASPSSGNTVPLFSPGEPVPLSQASEGAASVGSVSQPQLAQSTPKRRRTVPDAVCAVYRDRGWGQIELWFAAAALVPCAHTLVAEFHTPHDDATVRVTCQRSTAFPASDWSSVTVTATAGVAGPARQMVLLVPPLAPFVVPLESRHHSVSIELPGPLRPAARGVASAMIVASARGALHEPATPVPDLVVHSSGITNVNTARLMAVLSIGTDGWDFVSAPCASDLSNDKAP